jgi:signal transduction histidine kinase
VAEVALGNPDIDMESREAFTDILAESAESARLLEDMLTLARADSNQTNLRFEVMNLAELMDEVREKAHPLAEAKCQLLDVDHHGSAPICGDPSSVRRLLWTLVDNAIKYTPERGRIEMRLDTTASEARVTIRDDGIGIPQEMLPRVFERFFRADPSRAQVSGSGLGLAIAKWIADAHHARISLQSMEGHGTTVDVVFPLNGSSRVDSPVLTSPV